MYSDFIEEGESEVKRSSTSFWVSTLFCCLTFLVFGWYSLENPSDTARSVASSAEENVIHQFTDVQSRLRGLKASGKDDMTCTCQLGTDTNILKFEDPEACGKDRNYLDDSMKAMKVLDPKGYYTGGRDYSQTASILPRKCALFIMRRFWRDRARTPEERRNEDLEFNRTAPPDKQREIKDISQYKPDPHLFSKCGPNKHGVPERYGHKACVTEPYVNLVYNSLIDVADCLGVPAKFIAPKLSNESGLHVNAFGLVNDGGIGQFTKQALDDVVQNYDGFKGRITKSDKASCKRLRAIPGAVPRDSKDILTADENRCHSIAVPPNPLRSLIYYGVFYHATKRNADNAYNRKTDPKDPNFKSTEALMKEAGVAGLDQDKIREMMFVMGYNTGPSRPSSILREWLKYRIEQAKQCPAKKPCPVTKADFNMNYWPTKAQMQAKRGTERAQAIADAKNGAPLTLAEYIFGWKDNLYIAAVRAQARVLDQGLGEGTCTESKFLEL